MSGRRFDRNSLQSTIHQQGISSALPFVVTRRSPNRRLKQSYEASLHIHFCLYLFACIPRKATNNLLHTHFVWFVFVCRWWASCEMGTEEQSTPFSSFFSARLFEPQIRFSIPWVCAICARVCKNAPFGVLCRSDSVEIDPNGFEMPHSGRIYTIKSLWYWDKEGNAYDINKVMYI